MVGLTPVLPDKHSLLLQNGRPMADSIFNSVKKVVGLLGDDGSFDEDILLRINSVVSTLRQQ